MLITNCLIMKNTLIICLLAALISLISCRHMPKKQTIPVPNELAQEKTSPFESYTFKKDKIIVGLDGANYTLLKIDTIPIKTIQTKFMDELEGEWKKRFSEDLVAYMNEFGYFPKVRAQFTLADNNGDIKDIAVEFTADKRDQAKAFYDSHYNREIDPNEMLNRQQAIEDIAQLEKSIRNKYAYIGLNNVDLDQSIADLKNKIPEKITVKDFGLLLGQFINQFGDGHSRLRNLKFKEEGRLPFKVAPFKGKIICYKDGELLAPEFPYLHAINNIPVKELLAASFDYLTCKASPQYQVRAKTKKLDRIGLLLEKCNAYNKELVVELTNDEAETKRLMMPLRFPKPLSDLERLELYKKMDSYNPFTVKRIGDIAHIQIEKMSSPDAKAQVKALLEEVKDASAMIIDVRGNGGGGRDILLEMAPYFISSDQKYVIGNIAKLRTNTPEKHKSLGDRFIYQSNDDFFDAQAKQNIQVFEATFKPQYDFDPTAFSANYYLYITSNQDPNFGHKPTVVLMDEGCFSATDIFLSTFGQIDDVVLMGTKSSGGSGRARPYTLDHSLIQISLSSMISFQPNGELYDLNGVAPDIVVEKQSINDVIGKEDMQLDEAVKYLRNK